MYDCFCIVQSDNRSTFEYLLGTNKSVLIHLKNVQALALEVLKVAKNLSALIASEIFEKRNKVYDLENPSGFVLFKVHNVFHGIESITYLGPQIWNMVLLK